MYDSCRVRVRRKSAACDVILPGARDRIARRRGLERQQAGIAVRLRIRIADPAMIELDLAVVELQTAANGWAHQRMARPT